MSVELNRSAASGGESGASDGYRRIFLPLWAAMVALQSGLLIHDVGAAWIISQQTESRSIVALAQTAAALPFFLLALPAGALADMVERRRLAQAAAFVLSALSLAVAVASASGTLSVPLLLTASFVNGCCNAAFTPAWQAMTPELVDGERLPGALALNSLGINVARSTGPLISGLLLFASGPSAAFLFNALLYLAVGLAFLMLAPRRTVPAAPESLTSAIRGGIAYARHEPGLQAVSLRAVCFFLFAASFWALAPVVVRDWFGGSSMMLGAMVGCVGVGAVLAAQSLKALRSRFDLDAIMFGAGLTASLALALAPLAPTATVFALLHVTLGFCWLLCFSSIHLAAQLRLTPWIRARGTAVYLIAVFGSLALGSFLAGLLADRFGMAAAFWIAAGGLAAATVVARRRLTIAAGAPEKLTPSVLLPAAILDAPKGPILVEIRYLPKPEAQAAAADALHGLRSARLRSGARGWSSVRCGSALVERIEYDDAAAMARAAARQLSGDARRETELLGRLEAPPQAGLVAT
ncbi:MAG TPA: MFS transporter [Bosea sp. (in: a-proteobacteria)]|jgi:MFS family permease|uniref:MFS transporter n=1 Tax=Bosea sp. (in: a-proteobacteria) TaxID=1871050 RepID=UPI002E15DB0E|nr:MFS transporter [Bosea sp. (in: a-proteobacteria)]